MVNHTVRQTEIPPHWTALLHTQLLSKCCDRNKIASPYTRDRSKLRSYRLHFARKGHETVALAHSYFANIPEGLRYVLLAVASSRSKLELVKDGNAHRKSHRM